MGRDGAEGVKGKGLKGRDGAEGVNQVWKHILIIMISIKFTIIDLHQ